MAASTRASWRCIAAIAVLATQCRPPEVSPTSSSPPSLEIRLDDLAAEFTWSDGAAGSWQATEQRLARAREEVQQTPVRIIVVDASVTMWRLVGTFEWLRSYEAGDLVDLAVGDGSSGAAIRLTNRVKPRDPNLVCAKIELDDDGQRVKLEMHEAWRKRKSERYDPRPGERDMFVSRPILSAYGATLGAPTATEDASLPFEPHEDLFVAPGELADSAEPLSERVLARAFAASHPCPQATLSVARHLPWSRVSVPFAVLSALGVDELWLTIS